MFSKAYVPTREWQSKRIKGEGERWVLKQNNERERGKTSKTETKNNQEIVK